MAAPKLPRRYLYGYQPLATDRSFRLLKFGDFLHDELCELKTFDIDSCPPFSALSYTWGAPLNTSKSADDYKLGTEKILLLQTESGSRQLPLLKNLYEGLCHLTSSNKPDYLWVDAICINQDDESERASQVTMMGTIYSSCEQVIVWLGMENSDLKEFKWLHEVFLPHLWRYGETNGQESILKATWSVELIQKRLGLDTAKAWKSYAKFFQERRWFSRAWVMQELTLAPNVTVLAGKSKLDWDDMTTLANIISLNGLGLLIPRSHQSAKRSRQTMGFECLRLHTFRALFHQLAIRKQSSTPASRSSTFHELTQTESAPVSTANLDKNISMRNLKNIHLSKEAVKIARRVRTSSDLIKNTVPRKTTEMAKAIRASSSSSISKVPKLLSSSPSPNIGSWNSFRTWGSTLKSKFNFVYGADLETTRADVTGFSQWTSALIDNLTASNNRIDRWNVVFLCCCQWVRYFEATKHHDKIYGVLGIIDVLRPPDIPLPIYPDYTKPVEDLYTSIAWYFIQNLPHLTLLSCVQDKHSRLLKRLPSWVPDFSCESNEDLSFTVKADWNASRSETRQTYKRKLSGSVLELRGACLDVIDSTVPIFVPENWTSDGAYLPEGSVMSINILGHFEKIIRFVCEGKSWPYERSRLEVLVATLVAGHLSALPPRISHVELDEDKESYFPSFLPPDDGKDALSEDMKGLGIRLSPAMQSEPTSFTQLPEVPASSSPASEVDAQFISRSEQLSSTSLPNLSDPTFTPPKTQSRSSSLTSGQWADSPTSLSQYRKPSLTNTESFPYARAIFQFRCWVLSMLIAGSLSTDTAPHVESVLGAITQLAFLCPSSPGHAHLPTRSETEAAVTAARSLSTKNTELFSKAGLEGATGVGDFVQGQFVEFDVRWSKMLGACKMFRTKKGYLGMGPVGAEVGDQCWVLADARVPFVLRKTEGVDGRHEMVGETYLHGCMYGEVMTPDFLKTFGPLFLV